MNINKELTIGAILTVLFVGIVFLLMNGNNQTSSTLQNTSSTNPTVTVANQKTVISTTSYSVAEVAKHDSQNDCWMIINGEVYNATNYLYAHPGGAMVIIPYCGSDATAAFDSVRGHTSSRTQMDLSSLLIGTVK